MATEEQIKELAYSIWEKEGRPLGKDKEHYSRAMQVLAKREQSGSTQPQTPSPSVAVSKIPSVAEKAPASSKAKKQTARKKR